METRSDMRTAYRAVHPGEYLGEELKARGIRQNKFAASIGMQPSNLNEIIKGKRDVNSAVAAMLERGLGIGYSFWMSAQADYDHDVKVLSERRLQDGEASSYEASCRATLNLDLLYERLGIACRAAKDRVSALKSSLGFDPLPVAAGATGAGLFRHSTKATVDMRDMRTWVILDWHEISKVEGLPEYRQGGAAEAAREIARLANAGDIGEGDIKAALERRGIAYIVLPKLGKAPIDAYSTLYGGVRAVTVTHRYDDIDKLVFDVLHELCHIDRHLSRDCEGFVTADGIDYAGDPREAEADAFAREALIPEGTWREIMRAKPRNVSLDANIRAIAAEAERRGVKPSIAVARYKHDTKSYRTRLYRPGKIHP